MLKDDADITNCCDQGSAMMQPLFPRSFLSWPKAKGGHCNALHIERPASENFNKLASRNAEEG